MNSNTLFMIGGCAGSFPAPSENRPVFDHEAPEGIVHHTFQRDFYGSRTTSFLLRHRDTFIIIDQGLGVEPLADFIMALMKRENKTELLVHCLQTHFHEDHLSGLRGNSLLFAGGLTVRFYSPDLSEFLVGEEQSTADPFMQEVLKNTFRESFWPVTLERLDTFGAKREHISYKPGDCLEIDDLTVRTMPLVHPGGCCGLRFESNDFGAIVVATDYEPPVSPDPNVVEFFSGAKLLIADMQYRDSEYSGERAIGGVAMPREGWGHGTPERILPTLLACTPRPERVYISHHDPKRSDNELRLYYEEALEQLTKWGGASYHFDFARDGKFISL